MRILKATAVGIGSASAGFGAGMVGTIVVGPWTGIVCPAVTAGIGVGAMAMMFAFVLTLRFGRSEPALMSLR
jgi:hypothetical protein